MVYTLSDYQEKTSDQILTLTMGIDCEGQPTTFQGNTGKTGPLPQNGTFISRIFPYHRKHFHTLELDKTMEIGFSNLFLQYFQNVGAKWLP